MSPSLDAAPPDPPATIVSLVPSITESLFDLGLGERIVGITEWCVHPAAKVATVPKLGGTKNPDVDGIIDLRPALVIANHEENTERAIRKLDEAGLPVWVTYPRTVREGALLLAEIATLGASASATRAVVDPVLRAVEAAERARADRSAPATRVFCPIWRDPWMAPAADTYVHDMLELCGGRNVTAERPGTRYPQITLEEVVALQPEVVLLPDEPYAFGDVDVRDVAQLEIPAAAAGRVHPIDGTWVSWYGPRIEPALRVLRKLLA